MDELVVFGHVIDELNTRGIDHSSMSSGHMKRHTRMS